MHTVRTTTMLAAGLLVSLAASVASAGLIPLSASLDGAQAGTDSTATGTASLLYDTVARTLDITMNVTGIGLPDLRPFGPNSTPTHIHLAPPGVFGPIVVDIGLHGTITGDADSFELQGENIPIDPAQQGNATIPFTIDEVETALLSGNTFILVHTFNIDTPPFGEIRGQIVPEPASLAGLLVLSALAATRRRR